MFIPTYTFILFWVETDKQIRFFHLKLDSFILISSQAYKHKQVFGQMQEYLYFSPKITTQVYSYSVLFFHQFKKKSHLFVYSGLYFYSFLKKNPTYTFIQSYTFISFPKKIPPILLFGTVVYSELQSKCFHSKALKWLPERRFVGIIGSYMFGFMLTTYFCF